MPHTKFKRVVASSWGAGRRPRWGRSTEDSEVIGDVLVLRVDSGAMDIYSVVI